MTYHVEERPGGTRHARPASAGIGPTSRCRSCGAPVIWVLTERGRQMPVDAEPAAAGNFSVGRRADGTLLAIVRAEAWWGLRPGTARYTSHFATCPNAAAHRRTR